MFIKLNMDSLYETVSSFSSRFHGPEQHNNKNSEINCLFEIAKTNNEMMSSAVSNILGWPWGNSSKQVRLIHIHTSRHDSAVTVAQPTQARSGL